MDRLRVTGEAGVGTFRTEPFDDAALREILSARFQEPYRRALGEALGEPDDRILLLIDVVTGTLLHRLGMTGVPMAAAEVTALIETILPTFD